MHLSYLFDFGDEWRVDLTVVDNWEADDAGYPILVEAEGTAQPQYPEDPDD